MTAPLRIGFLISGLLHMAVVAAFSLSYQDDLPALDEPRPLTLQLAMYRPAQAAAPHPAPSRPEPSPARAEPVPPARIENASDLVEPLAESEPATRVEVTPEPLPPSVRRAEPRPRLAEPRSSSRPVVKKQQTRRLPHKERKNPDDESARPRPRVVVPPSSPTVQLAAVNRPQPTTPTVEVEEKQHYLAALASKIDRRKYYPARSRRRGEEGRVVVRFVIRKDGELSEIAIVESSGSRRLDAAALKTLRRVSPFHPIPDTLDRERWPITVPIAFSLRR